MVGASLTLSSCLSVLVRTRPRTPPSADKHLLFGFGRGPPRPLLGVCFSTTMAGVGRTDDQIKSTEKKTKKKKIEEEPTNKETAAAATLRTVEETAPSIAGKPVEIEDYSFEGISIGGHETCIIVPKLKLAFDIGRCPQRAIAQDFLFISHAHMDHIGGVAMYVATRGLYKMKPPTVIVPKCIKETVEKLFEVYRSLDGSELNHKLVGLDVGESYCMGKGLLAKAFKTYHVIPSQGYIIYSVRHKLKQEYLGLSGKEIKSLKESGVEITNEIMVPEVAFTGDTMADFIVDDNNADVLKAKVLIMEATFVDDTMSVEHAREYGHTHISEVAALADRFLNKGILFIHFSARYRMEEIKNALQNLPRSLQERTFALLEGF